jgi:HD-GYP domain-containing protein (c-di-GMP phosphodiesterase class II)
MGRSLGLDEAQLERLHFAALLHDLGMLKIDPRRIGDPGIHRLHASLGARMLSRIKLWEDLGPMVLHHHERWDGAGYPEGLAGDDIPLESRIIALADTFDSMTSASSYREPRDFDDALAQVESCAGSQFDPRVASAFLELVEQGVIPREVD